MSSYDKSPTRKKTKRKTKATAKKVTRMKTQTTATLSERPLICVSGLKNGTRKIHQHCSRSFGFAAGRVPQSHPERRDPHRRFSCKSLRIDQSLLTLGVQSQYRG